jgi:hypothetical protein
MSDEPKIAVEAGSAAERYEAATQIVRSTMRLVERAPTRFPPIADLLLIIENLGNLARDVIEAEFPVEYGIEDLEGRSNWFKTVSFLAMTGAFPALEQLAAALSDLDRGRQPESLKPFYTGKGSGARTTHFELMVQQQAVEAADRVASFCVKDEERDAAFQACGATARTIERYRESCLKGWPMYWPRQDACVVLERDEAESALRGAMQRAKLLKNTRPSKASRAN